METEELFVRFMALICMYYQEESDVRFYAGRLEVTPDYLLDIIREKSGYSFSDWLEILKKESISEMV